MPNGDHQKQEPESLQMILVAGGGARVISQGDVSRRSGSL